MSWQYIQAALMPCMKLREELRRGPSIILNTIISFNPNPKMLLKCSPISRLLSVDTLHRNTHSTVVPL